MSAVDPAIATILLDRNPGLLRRHLAFVIAAAVLLGLVGIELAAVMWLNNGVLVYTLDDPYIHLALAENIWRGHYGVNLLEASAPASSIAWPFLLAPFAGSASAPYLLFALNCSFAIATLLVCYRLLDRSLGRPHPWLIAWLLVLLTLATNVVGLVFTGMEHSLQLLLAATIALGLAEESDHGRVAPWLIAAILLAPLVRYETLAVSFAALAYLALRRHVALAAWLLLATLLLLGAFSLFLVSLGLEPLPTSVLAKSDVAARQGHLAPLAENLVASLRHDRGVLLGVCLMVFLSRALLGTQQRPLAVAGALAIVMHLAAGQYGWYHRYEIYVWGFSVLLLIALFAARFEALLTGPSQRGSAVKVAALAGIAVGVLCFRYLIGLSTIPLAANNIYEQQYQMHRFAVEFYRGPVAVNDLGYVAWRNDAYVLDLWGLASLTALQLRKSGADPDWIERLASERGAQVAMIYSSWFTGEIPPGWIKLGELRLGKPKVTPAHSRVAFYAAGPAAGEAAAAALRAFIPTLPPGVRFVPARERQSSAGTHSVIRLNSRSGMLRMTSMTQRQNQGVYTTSSRRSIARTMSRATSCGSATSGEPGSRRPQVIAVSTKPGFTVMTAMPREATRLRRPCR